MKYTHLTDISDST